jgi:cytochrome c-type biogenesis protein CcmF
VVVLAVALRARGLSPLLAFGLAGFGAGSAGRQIVLATRRQGWRGLVGRADGGMVVHLGVVLIAVGIAASSSYGTQSEPRLARGATATVAGHTVQYVDRREFVEGNRTVVGADVLIDGAGPYLPALEKYGTQNDLVSKPSVRSRPTGDVMLALLDLPENPDDPVHLRVIVQPLVMWMWIGGGLMALGTALAAVPTGLFRRPTDPVSAPVGGAPEPAVEEPEPDPDPEPVGVS